MFGRTKSTLVLPLDLELSDIGVSLTAISDFVESCGGVKKLKGLTTLEVCEKYMKPKTLNRRVAYTTYIKENKPKMNLQPANVYVCHTWSYQFIDVCDALVNTYNDEGDGISFWFDIFCYNQHFDTNSINITPQWLIGDLKPLISKIGRTVVILTPWNDPIPLKRAWCLFELYCTIESNGSFEIALSLHDQENFDKDITTEYDAVKDTIVGHKQQYSKQSKNTRRDAKSINTGK